MGSSGNRKSWCRLAGAVLSVATLASLGMVGVGTANAAESPSWASNQLFAEGLSAFTKDAKANLSRWCHPVEGAQVDVNQTCNLRDPKDLGVIRVNGSYNGYYATKGYLSASDYDIKERPDYGLTVQSYETTLAPGHYGYFAVSRLPESDNDSSCPSPIAMGAHIDGDTSQDAKDAVVVGTLRDDGISQQFTGDAKQHSGFADWLLAKDTTTQHGLSDHDVYKNGDNLFLQHLTYGYNGGGTGGNISAGGACYMPDDATVWFQVSNDDGGKAAKASFALTNADADVRTYRKDYSIDYSNNRVRVEYFESAYRPNKDVTDTTPHRLDVLWLQAKGITTGYSDDTFRGDRAVVRQDMAAFLYRLAGSPKFDAAKAKNPFVDVDRSTPHYKEILWLASTGISAGWDTPRGREFRGQQPVARQDMAAFLHRLADYRNAKPKLDEGVEFDDVNAKTPHAEDIAWLAKTRVTTGWVLGQIPIIEFRGMNTVVRQDMAAFLHRMKSNVLK